MRKFGVMYGIKGRRKKAKTFDTDFARNSEAKALKDAGFAVRRFTRKAADNKQGWV